MLVSVRQLQTALLGMDRLVVQEVNVLLEWVGSNVMVNQLVAKRLTVMKPKKYMSILKIVKHSRLLFCALITLACQDNAEHSYRFNELQPVAVYDGPADSSSYFFSNISAIEVSDDKIALCEQGNKHVKIVNSDFELLNLLGREGYGPGEFSTPLSMALDNGNFYVVNDGNRAIQKYDSKGSFLASIPVPDWKLLFNRFAVEDETIFLSNGDNPLLKFHETSSVAEAYGVHYDYQYSSDEEKFKRNHKHVFVKEDKIITVGQSEPIIEIFDKNAGRLIDHLDFSSVPEVKSRLAYRDAKYLKDPQKRESSIITLVEDAAIFKNRLYALIYENPINRGVKCNKVLVFDFSDGINLQNVLSLGNSHENYIQSIGVGELGDNETVLLAFDYQSQSLLKYSLDNLSE